MTPVFGSISWTIEMVVGIDDREQFDHFLDDDGRLHWDFLGFRLTTESKYLFDEFFRTVSCLKDLLYIMGGY